MEAVLRDSLAATLEWARSADVPQALADLSAVDSSFPARRDFGLLSRWANQANGGVNRYGPDRVHLIGHSWGGVLVRVIVLLPQEDEAGNAWMEGVAREWADELEDPRQDIYTLEDGQPLDAPR